MKTRKNLNNFLVMLVFSLATLCTAATGGTIYVDDDVTGANDGSSWTDAYNYLQDALAAASSGDEIRVAEGVYKPDQGATVTLGDREATFHLKNGVAIYGGIVGGERILSGDIGTASDSSDNSYHVVTGSGTNATAVLDGFTITGGNANGFYLDWDYGAGMVNYIGSPTVTNCTFSGNSAGYGGGMANLHDSSPTLTNCTFSGNSVGCGGGTYNRHSSPTLSNCTFSGNSAVHGGGMANWDDSSPTLTNCTFSGNSAENGGGMHNETSSPTVTHCMFSGNGGTANWYGGGMFNSSSSSPTVANCTFSGNSAYRGGGMSNFSSSPTVTDCTFSGNWARDGGGMHNYDGSPTLTNCTFKGNSAGSAPAGTVNVNNSESNEIQPRFLSPAGGGMFNVVGSSPTLTNCTFIGNSASYSGGMGNNVYSSPTLTNCTFSGNSASVGGGMWNNYDSTPTLTNCILWGDTADTSGAEIVLAVGSTLTVSYSDVDGGEAAAHLQEGCTLNWGDGNIDADPMFADADLRLSAGSPCINAGSNAALPPDTADLDGDGDTTESIPLDLDGNARISNGIVAVVDMGAYECMADPENTPPGDDVEVFDPETGTMMLFDTVGSGGDTTVTITTQGPPPPTGLKLVPLGIYYEIDTTAEFTGMVHIAIEYDDTELTTGQEMALKLRCYEGDEWVNITTDLDMVSNIIYGETDHLSLFAITTEILVDIDIKPGSYPNAINLGSQGVIPVAILSSSDFDATTVNPDTVELAGEGVAMRGKTDKYMAHEEDVNGDGLLDLVCQVETENLDPETFQYGFMDLTGETYDGVPIKGFDEIIIVPPDE